MSEPLTAWGGYEREYHDSMRHAQRKSPTTRTEDRRAAAVGARDVGDVPTRAEAEEGR